MEAINLAKVAKVKCLTCGNNGGHPLPGESGETHLPNLSGNNGGFQLPGESGESQVPNLSGNNGHRPLG